MMESLSFDDVFKLSTWCMRMNGSHPSLPRNINWTIRFVFVIGIYITHFCFILNSIFYYDMYQEHVAESVCKSGALLIISFIITIKYFSLILYRRQNVWLMRYIDEDYVTYLSLGQDEQTIVNEYIQRGAWICKLWCYTPFICGGVFTLRPVVIMIYRYLIGEFRSDKIFEYTYPSGLEERKDEFIIFVPMFILNVLFVLCAASMYSGFDSLAPIFMLHVCGQLEVAKMRILKLFLNDNCNVFILKQNVNLIIMHLQNIYRFVC